MLSATLSAQPLADDCPGRIGLHFLEKTVHVKIRNAQAKGQKTFQYEPAEGTWRVAYAALSSALLHLFAILCLGCLYFAWNSTPPLDIVLLSHDWASEQELTFASVELEPVEAAAPSLADFTLAEDLVSSDVGDLATLSLRDGLQGVADTTGLSEAFLGKVHEARELGLDILIVFDSTGSMSAEIDAVKQRIGTIGRALLAKIPNTRFSLITYRDEGDSYVVRGIHLTNDLAKIQDFLSGVYAGGGGDFPEAVDVGMKWAVMRNRLQDRRQNVMLLFGDAPPHVRGLPSCLQTARQFHKQERGTVSTISCGSEGLIPEFYEIARAGGGEAYTLKDSRWLMEELLVLAFGGEHRQDVLKFFELDHNGR